MKNFRGLFLAATTLALSGCGKEQNSPSPAVAPAPVAPAAMTATPAAPPDAANGYLGTLARGQQKAVKTIDVTSLNEEINLFNVQEGHFPKDLDELVTQHYIPSLPYTPAGMKLVYDASQGKVSVVPQ
jgi:hypothetical protein